MDGCIALEGRDAMRVRGSGFTAKLKSGPRRQFGPRRSPERFWCFHRVIGPIQLYGNTDFHLGRSWVKTGYVAHGHFCCIHRYTRARVPSRPSRAIQLYSAIQRYSIHYTAIHRYTLYNLYNTPLVLLCSAGCIVTATGGAYLA